MARIEHPSGKADEIGAATRQLVEDYLGRYPEFEPPGGFLERMEIFAAELARWGSKFNLTAAPDDPAELAFHLLDSLMPLVLAARERVGELANGFTAGKRILDLGSGAGFPALILAAATEAEFTLVESRRKRASFLQTAIGAMGLSNAKVDSQYRRVFAPEFDVVTARAFARPVEFYEVAATGLTPNGIALLYASERQRGEIEAILKRRGDASKFYAYKAPRIAIRSTRDQVDCPDHLIVISSQRGRGILGV